MCQAKKVYLPGCPETDGMIDKDDDCSKFRVIILTNCCSYTEKGAVNDKNNEHYNKLSASVKYNQSLHKNKDGALKQKDVCVLPVIIDRMR